MASHIPDKPSIHGLPGRKAARQRLPADTTASHMEDRVDDFPHRPLPIAVTTPVRLAASGRNSPTQSRSHRFHSAAPRGYAARIVGAHIEMLVQDVLARMNHGSPRPRALSRSARVQRKDDAA